MKLKSRINKKIYKYETSSYNRRIWYKNGVYHRDKGLPTFIESDGDTRWYENGELHRDNGLPAIVDKNDYSFFYYKGTFIRFEINK